jgi:hypothetical protein
MMLVALGLLVGYPSGQGVMSGMWGGGGNAGRSGFYLFAFLAAAMCVLAGFIALVSTESKSLFSPALASEDRRDGAPETENTLLLVRLKAIVIAILVASFCAWTGLRFEAASRSRRILLSYFLYFLYLLPLGIALQRIWTAVHKTALSVILVFAAEQIVATLYFGPSGFLFHSDLWTGVMLLCDCGAIALVVWIWTRSRHFFPGIAPLASICLALPAYIVAASIVMNLLARL